MPQFRLRALMPGTRCIGRNADGAKIFATFTPEYCREQYQRNNALLAKGIPVPVCLDHRDDAKPGKASRDDIKSRRVEGTTGWVERYEQLADGSFDAIVAIPHRSDAKRAEAIRFCSPELDYFTDDAGKDWGEVITHLALTPRPRQRNQPPIMRLGASGTLSAGPIRLAVDPKEGSDMADEKDDDTEDTKRKAKDAQDGDKKDDDEEKDTPTEFGSLIEALQSRGFQIPEEVTDMTHLIIAIKANPADCGKGGEEEDPYGDQGNVTEVARPGPVTMSHGSGEDDAEDDDEQVDEEQVDEDDTADAGSEEEAEEEEADDDDDDDDEQAAAHPPAGDDEDDEDEDDDTGELEPPTPARKAATKKKAGARMSHEPTDPALKKQRAEAVALARKGIVGRFNRLVRLGCITPAVAQAWIRKARKIRLSFSKDGDLDPANEVLIALDAYEQLPKGGTFTTRDSRTRMGHARAVKRPEHVTKDNGAADESLKARKKRNAAFDTTIGRRSES